MSLGGDGTFLRVVRLAWTDDVPVLGVNFGRLGYLPDLVPDQVRVALTRVFEGRAVIEARCTLEVTITDRSQGDATSTYLALNEVVLEKIDFGHTVRLATSIDGEDVFTYSADGVIIATPTGSTAYNLSARGPILSPSLRAMVVTPVAPHLSLDRSLVLTDTQRVTGGDRAEPGRRARHRRTGDGPARAWFDRDLPGPDPPRTGRAERPPRIRRAPAIPAAGGPRAIGRRTEC